MSTLWVLVGSLIHTFGLLIFGGGEVWITFLMAKSQGSKGPHGKIFVMEILESVGKLMFAGLILLIIGGIIRMIADRSTTIWGNTNYLWGTTMLIKHVLVAIILVVGIIMVARITPALFKTAPKPDQPPSKEFLKNISLMQKVAKTNLLLTMIVVVLSVIAISRIG